MAKKKTTIQKEISPDVEMTRKSFSQYQSSNHHPTLPQTPTTTASQNVSAPPLH